MLKMHSKQRFNSASKILNLAKKKGRVKKSIINILQSVGLKLAYVVRFHSLFFKDLDKLSKKDLEIFEKKKGKIMQNPIRLKHLSGGENCYREEITTNIRLIYYVEGNIIWMLIIGRHDQTYAEYRKRLYSLQTKYL